MTKFAAVVLGLSICLNMATGLNQIVRVGNLFFDSFTGNQFWVRGVDYQPKNSIGQNYDVLADPNTIYRDIQHLKDLGLNAIRVYETDSTLNHDLCMQILDANGIYVILDVPTPSTSISSDNPMWNQDLFTPFAAKIDAFSQYGNILAYIASNEVSNNINTTGASAFVKAAVRDIKAYVKSKGLSTPVGYAIADAGDIASNQEAYFACSTNPADNPDFYGINIYRWCGSSNYELSGYNQVTQTFRNWPIAVLFSEYGCNVPSPRYFGEVLSLYSSNMTGVFSGGLVYEYSQETNNYGLVQVNFANNTVTPLVDYVNYRGQLAQVHPTSSVTLTSYVPAPKTVACPAVNATAWQAASSPLPPAIDAAYCSCILSTLTCRFNADSSAALKNLASNITSIYSFICGSNAAYCTNITTNPTSGVYGMLSACDALTRISATMNSYYLANVGPNACGFSGLGRTQTPQTTTCTASTMSSSPSVTRVTITTSNSLDSTSTSASTSTVSTGTTTGPSSTGTTSTSPTSSTSSGVSSTGSSGATTSNTRTVTHGVNSASMVACGGILVGIAVLVL